MTSPLVRSIAAEAERHRVAGKTAREQFVAARRFYVAMLRQGMDELGRLERAVEAEERAEVEARRDMIGARDTETMERRGT